MTHRLLLFGATGAIGSAVAAEAARRGWSVTGVSRGEPSGGEGVDHWISYDPVTADGAAAFAGQAPFNSVCWAQGMNFNDALGAFDSVQHLAMYEANCLSVIKSADVLVNANLLVPDGARLVVVSSIWQERARQQKMSYAVTKAAIGGFVRSASVDLGEKGHLVNAVLPGVLDTAMTAANLSAAQLEKVRSKTSLNRLPDLATVVSMILFLCSRDNHSITGQSVTVDLGMNNANLL